MKQRPLGNTGLQVSEIGFGAWQLCNDDSWGRMDEETAYRLVQEALEGGINLFDTAPNYAHTKSEQVLGHALRGYRHELFGRVTAGLRGKISWSLQLFVLRSKKLFCSQERSRTETTLISTVEDLFSGATRLIPIWGSI